MDADKEEYLQYLDWAIDNVRVGGIIAAHNALRHGKVLNPDNAWDFALVEYNKRIASDERLSSYIMNVGDGLAVSIRKS
jgi:caffeoyl-CoA O-methyltransferase